MTVPELGAGADDEIRTYAVENDRNVVTEDPDFIDGSADPGTGMYPGVIFCTDRSSEVSDDVIVGPTGYVGRYHGFVKRVPSYALIGTIVDVFGRVVE